MNDHNLKMSALVVVVLCMSAIGLLLGVLLSEYHKAVGMEKRAVEVGLKDCYSNDDLEFILFGGSQL